MEFERSSLYQEVRAIISDGPKPIAYTYKAEIHIGDVTYLPYKVMSIDEVFDYETMYAAEITITLDMPGGMYAYDVYQNQDNIDITLYRYPLLEAGDVPNREIPVRSERYTAVLYSGGNKAIEANALNQPTKETLDKTKVETVRFQLVDKAMEQLRAMTVGGNFRDTTPGEVIRAMLTVNSQKIKVDDRHRVLGVDMVPASNQRKLSQISVEYGTPLRTLPEFIQEHYGVYSAGMGYFFQSNRWYVYPIYDTERFNQSERSITVVNVPRNRFVEIERTYRLDGDHPVIMATGDVQFRDDSTVQQLNGGNGARYLDANVMMGSFTQNAGNKAIAARAKNASEFIGFERPDGNNLVLLDRSKITANPYTVYSSLARRDGSVFAFNWENSDPDLIEPGTTVKLMFLEEETITTMYGVVLKRQSYHHLIGQGYTSTRYRTNTVLSLFVKRAPT